MDSRIGESVCLLNDQHCYQIHIDENEYERLYEIVRSHGFEYQSNIIWDKKNPMMGSKGIASQHEYVVIASESDEPFPMKNENTITILNYKDNLLKKHGEDLETSRKLFREWINKNNSFSGGERAYNLIDDDGRIYQSVGMSWPNPKPAPPQFFIPLKHPVTGENCPVPPRGWSRSPEKMQELIEKNEIVFGKDHTTQPRRKIYLTSSNRQPLKSLIENGSKGKTEVDNLALNFSYCHPTSLYEDLIYAGLRGVMHANVLDYFAGSGTTAHAVINLNREDDGERKYILTEMGNHFDTVLKPRLAKVAYASEWKNGKPVSRDTGISHCFKYIRLESYEDTLGNLRLERKLGQQSMFAQTSNDAARQAYVMNYMLDVETRGSQSLLNIQQFLDPTQYQLNVRSASGDETVPVNVDLLETFNYLLGLEVEHIATPIYFDAEISQGEFGRWQAKVKRSDSGQWWFRTVYGKNRNGQQVLVVWRNLPSVIAGEKDGVLRDNAVLDAVLVERLKIRLTESLDDEIDILYVNGDHNIHIPRDRQGQPMEQARVQLIEEAFHRLMFADTEAVH